MIVGVENRTHVILNILLFCTTVQIPVTSCVHVAASTRSRFQISAIASNVKTQSILFPLEMASRHCDQERRIIAPKGQSQWQLVPPFTGHFRLALSRAEWSYVV